jgi:hypothetical protein
MIVLATARGCPASEANSPLAAFDAIEDWSCVFTTSNGLVSIDATVPATPPEKKFNTCLCLTVSDGVAVDRFLDRLVLVAAVAAMVEYLLIPCNETLFMGITPFLDREGAAVDEEVHSIKNSREKVDMRMLIDNDNFV